MIRRDIFFKDYGNAKTGRLDENWGSIVNWDPCFAEYYTFFDFYMSFDGGYKDTELRFLLTSQQGCGELFSIRPADGAPALYDGAGAFAAKIPADGAEHCVSIKISYASGEYEIYVDGKGGIRPAFPGKIYRVNSLRLDISGGEDSYIILSKLHFRINSIEYAQEYSCQPKGEVPELDIPDAPDPTRMRIWLNKTELKTDAAPFEEDGTVYIPLFCVLEAAGIDAVEKDGAVNAGKFTVGIADGTVAADGKTVALRHPLKYSGGVIMAPAELFSRLLDAKCRLDREGNMTVISTGKYKNDDVLRALGNRFYMNGEPYYEISFNKFDLYDQIAGDARFNGGKFPRPNTPDASAGIEAAEESLRQLHEAGFRSIRVFCGNIGMFRRKEETDRFFEITDFMYDLCDKYDIKVVPCMNLVSGQFIDSEYLPDGSVAYTGKEYVYDLFCVPESRSAKNLSDFLDAYVGRYKNRKTILMWEIRNEGNLEADIGNEIKALRHSLTQLGDFYAFCADCIHRTDPDRPVTGGDSILRPSQWHLYLATMAGRGSDFTVDSREDRLKALYVMHYGLDAISMHGYNVGYEDKYVDTDGEMKCTTWKLFLDEAARLDLPFYNGETAGQFEDDGTPTPYGNCDPRVTHVRENYLDSIIDAGVQLTHWWTFHSDRRSCGNDVADWSIRADDETAATFEAVKAADAKLRARYLINPIAEENV